MLGKKRRLKKISKTEPSFLSKLYQILNDKEYYQYIHWSHDGLSVIISDSTGLTKKVLPKFYNHHNYASFVRQLNMYNFRKIRGDPKSNDQKYVHSEFYKGKSIQEIQEIRRKIKTDEEKDKNSNKNYSDKKIGTINHNNDNLLEDKINLNKIEELEDSKKFIEYQNLVKNGDVSTLSNETILNFLLEKLKQSEENHKNIENEISNLVKQNNNLIQQLKSCDEKLSFQKDFCQKMKGLVIFLVTLVMRKNQNYKICKIDIGGGRDNNNNNKKSTDLADFVRKFLDHQKTKNGTNDIKKDNNTTTINTNINTLNIGNKTKKINSSQTIQKGENFTINNDDLFKNLKTNNLDESFKDYNDLSMSFSKNFNYDLDLKKGNSLSSINLFNSSVNLTQKKL